MLKLSGGQLPFSVRDPGQNVFRKLNIFHILGQNSLHQLIVGVVEFFGQMLQSIFDISSIMFPCQ
jgi:hypothetical protein